MTTYEKFIENKSQLDTFDGFNPVYMPDHLFEFQKYLVDLAVRKGRYAIFADCGLGKTPMQLAWAENVVRKTNGNVLIVAPLAVSAQTVREGKKFNTEVNRSMDGTAHKGITITNYERLDYFKAEDFVGMVCDESSILKNFNGTRKKEITTFMRKLKYRLLCTATAAPNDYFELGTSSEALGYMGAMDMLNKFFKNDQNNSSTGRHYGEVMKWRFKGHAEELFWRWVCSWSRAVRMPSDIGYTNDGFVLPKLTENEIIVKSETKSPDMLFSMQAIGLYEQREESRRTIRERCEMAARTVDTKKQAIVWCQMNDEGDLLEEIIPDCVQLSGKDSDEKKEESFMAFADGKIRVLVTKPKIGAWGLNFQNCAHMTFFPSHSFEQYYQSVRRCWRFGQKKEVMVDIISTEGSQGVIKNIRRKAAQAEKMFEALSSNMRNALHFDKSSKYNKQEEVPSWL